MMKDRVLDVLQKHIGSTPIRLLTPKNEQWGDYSISVHQFDPSKRDTIIQKLKSDRLFESVTLVNNFVNVQISTNVVLQELADILTTKDAYGAVKRTDPQRILFEFGQPNTHKLPHIGHLFSYCYGEACVRLLEKVGNELLRANYQGDIGLHVAKCLYIVQKQKDTIQSLRSLEEKVQFLQQCYQEGSRLYEKDEQAKKEIDQLNKQIYEHDTSIKQLWNTTRQWSLTYYKNFEKKLGIVYDRYYFESETAPVGKKLVQDTIGRVFEESDGAVVFHGKKYGLHTRVFINHYGNPTYEAKDIGLIYLKQKDWPFDKAILTTAAEQNAYYQVVRKAIELIFPDLVGKIEHIGFGMIDLKGGKMSSRTGEIVSAMDLTGEVEERIKKLIDTKGKTDLEIQHISEVVGMAAIKYSFLRSEARKNMSFDLNDSIATTGNSGPYLLYTYARTQSVLSKSKVFPITNYELPITEPELMLLRALPRFPEVVADAAEKYAPHLLCTYLFDLAQRFSVFYERCPILTAQKDQKELRLALTMATAQILKNGLHLLGIETLERI